MKTVTIIFLAYVFFAFFSFVNKIQEVELIILDLYKHNFENYLTINDSFEVEYDLELLSDFFEKEGCSFEKKDGDLNFVLSFEKVWKWEKQYEFNLYKNYGN